MFLLPKRWVKSSNSLMLSGDVELMSFMSCRSAIPWAKVLKA